MIAAEKYKFTIRKVCIGVSYVFLFLCSIIALAPLVGTIWCAIGIKWSIIPAIIILFIAAFSSFKIVQYDLFQMKSAKELVVLGGVMLFVLFIYIQYSPVLSVQQDQALYIMKTFNLLNYGTLEKPVDTFVALTENGIINSDQSLYNYGSFENGCQIRDGALHPDFYAGSSFFYAMCGLIRKDFAFFGQTLVMVACCWLLYCLIRRVLVSEDKLVAALYTMTFAVSPVIMWFGRSSSTEPTALFFWLLIVCLLLDEDIPLPILATVFMVALSARIDYLLVALLGAFIITYKNRKCGAIYTVCTAVFMYVTSKVFWIYYNRIGARDFKIIKYQIILIIGAFIVSFFISKYGKRIIENIYNYVACKYILIVIGFGVLCMMYRNTLTPEKYYGKFTEFGLDMYSYEEFILDHLYQTFPAIIIAVGLVGCYKILKHKKINMLAGIFILSLLVVSCYFVYKSGNAPQMYFLLRRYYNIFLPALLLAFVVFIESKHREKNILIAMALFLLACNLYMDSKQKVQYAELDKNVERFAEKYPESEVGTLFYDHEDKFDISPIVSYCSYDVVPVQNENELEAVSKNQQYYDSESSIYLTTKKIDNIEYKDIVDMSYYTMNETLLGIPRDYIYEKVDIYIYPMEDVISMYAE